jgi:hypothetical protein
VGKGNYPKHIVDGFMSRGNWKLVEEDDAIEKANFYWRQLNLSFLAYDKFDTRTDTDKNNPFIFNHFEVNRGICTKTGLVRSLRTYYENLPAAVAAGYTVFDSTPTTFIVSRTSDDSEITHLMNRFS